MEFLAGHPHEYLDPGPVVESDHPDVRRLAHDLRTRNADDVDFARAAFEWVRDQITHSVDADDSRVTITASEVLHQGTGLCFAKSHLLVAILRAERIPAGLCYQRLTDGERHLLHGLVAVYLANAWHRIDPRGNRSGLDAQFSLVQERIAYRTDPKLGERDYRRVFQQPSRTVIDALAGATDALTLCRRGLPSSLPAG